MQTNKNVMWILGVVFAAVGAVLTAGAAVFLCLGGKMWIPALPLGINGVIFLTLGVVFIIIRTVKQRRNDDLRARGELITAQVVGLEPDMGVTINGRHPMRLVCKYEENGTTYICHSDDISGYPELVGTTVPVYRDPYNIKHYFVDAQSVLKETVEL